VPEPVPSTSSVVLVLGEEEATALVSLGVALEPFIEDKSPADTATAKMDEQLAQQGRGKNLMIDEAADELAEQLYDVPNSLLPNLHTVAEAVLDRALGVYS
jgi:hypothetical protein